jgi:hypothetical protein
VVTNGGLGSTKTLEQGLQWNDMLIIPQKQPIVLSAKIKVLMMFLATHEYLEISDSLLVNDNR